jgi:potassium/chloride transporter 4/5/6
MPTDIEKKEQAWSSIYQDEDAIDGGVNPNRRTSMIEAVRRTSVGCEDEAEVIENGESKDVAEPEAKKEALLGLVWGVYLPTTQNILGVILFLRLPWIVAQAGIIQTLIIIFLCVGSTFLTSLSLSAIATNGKISAGGPYFVISRNLGVELGGAIGCIFYLGTTFAASMYVLGAVESFQTGFYLQDQFTFDLQVEALILVFFMAFTVFVGVKYVNMAATPFLMVVILSIVSAILGCFLYLGGVWQGDVADGADVPNDNWGESFEPDEETGITPTFFSLIGLFYPSVTGIMAGSNRSGVLANPSKDIPIGTIGAIVTTTVIYLVVVLLMGTSLSNEYLKEDKLAFASVAWPPVLVNIGIVLSSVGAGMQSLTGAPRLLAAIANDGAIPFLDGFACPGDQNPSKAIWLTYAIASVPCLAGNLDYITPLVTLFFLVMYTSVNFSAFLLSFLKSPGFRPTWKYFSWWTALLGTTWCFVLMVLINWYITIIVLFLVGCLFLYIKSKHAQRDWGDSTSGLKFSIIRSTLNSLTSSSITHAKNWRPQALVVLKMDKSGEITDTDLLNFAGQMKKARGLSIFIGCIEGDPIKDIGCVAAAEEKLVTHLKDSSITGFSRVILVNRQYDAFITAYQTVGIGALKPNTVVTSWNYDWKEDSQGSTDFVNQLKGAVAAKLAIIIFKQSQEDQRNTVIANDTRFTGTIDIWWVVHDGGLLLLIPYLLTLHKVYSGCKLRVFAVATDSLEGIEGLTEKFLAKIRIQAEIVVVNIALDDAELPSDYTQPSSLPTQDLVQASDSGVEMTAALGSGVDEDNLVQRRMERSGSTVDFLGKNSDYLKFASSLNHEMKALSSDAVLVVTNLPISLNCTPEDFMTFTSMITKDIKACALIRGTGNEVVTKYG